MSGLSTQPLLDYYFYRLLNLEIVFTSEAAHNVAKHPHDNKL